MLYTVEQHFYSNNSHWVYQIILSVSNRLFTLGVGLFELNDLTDLMIQVS